MNVTKKSSKKGENLKIKKETSFKRMTQKILAKPFKDLKRPEEDII